MDKNSRIFVAGHRGLVGSAIWKALESQGYTHLIGRTHRELDLEDPPSGNSLTGKSRNTSFWRRRS